MDKLIDSKLIKDLERFIKTKVEKGEIDYQEYMKKQMSMVVSNMEVIERNQFTVGLLNDFMDLIDILSATDKKWVFRGEGKRYETPLVSSVMREWNKVRSRHDHLAPDNFEEEILKEYSRNAYSKLESEVYKDSRMELRALAQHHGLPTRFVDWTTNPLTALYFAVKENFEKTKEDVFGIVAMEPEDGEREEDGFVYCLNIADVEVVEYSKDQKEETDWSSFDGAIKVYNPVLMSDRIKAQNGLFVFQTDLSKPIFEVAEIKKIRIPFIVKSAVLSKVVKMGFRESVMFPDLDGIALDIKMSKEITRENNFTNEVYAFATAIVSKYVAEDRKNQRVDNSSKL